MSKFQKVIVKLLMSTLIIVIMSGCDKPGEVLPLIKFGQVREFTRDSCRTIMDYEATYGRLSLIQYQVNDYIRSTSGILYTSQGMNCDIDGLTYEVKLDATIGGSRAFSVTTSIDGGSFYYVEYQYDAAGKLHLAKLIRQGETNVAEREIWISYKYTDNNLEINEGGTIYNIPLSAEENTGYVCNVYAFAEAPLTNKYVINPELYFLNIYGMPIEHLPAEQKSLRVGNEDNRLSSVGKYYYKY